MLTLFPLIEHHSRLSAGVKARRTSRGRHSPDFIGLFSSLWEGELHSTCLFIIIFSFYRKWGWNSFNCFFFLSEDELHSTYFIFFFLWEGEFHSTFLCELHSTYVVFFYWRVGFIQIIIIIFFIGGWNSFNFFIFSVGEWASFTLFLFFPFFMRRMGFIHPYFTSLGRFFLHIIIIIIILHWREVELIHLT